MKAVLMCLLIAGCTTATVHLPDGTEVAFQRFWTDADLQLSEDGMHYSSNPQAVAIEDLLGLLVKGAMLMPKGGPPVYRPQSAMPMMLHASEAGL